MKLRNLITLTLATLLLTTSVGFAAPKASTEADKAAAAKPAKKKILFFSQSLGFRHGVVARPLTGEMAYAEKEFKKMTEAAGFEVMFSQDANDLKGADQFKRFDIIVLYTTGEVPINRLEMTNWLKAGGALVGIHSATDSFYKWEDYGKWFGGYFKTHGGNTIPVAIKNEMPDHPATVMLGEDWAIADEIYQLKDFKRDTVKMLLSIDTAKMSDEALKHHNMKKDQYYPVAWTNTLDDGRIFYSSLGHREDVWTNPKYQAHIIAGIKWAAKMDCDKGCSKKCTKDKK